MKQTAAESNYMHGVTSLVGGIRETHHALKRENREHKEVLRRLDEAHRVAIYLHDKVESLMGAVSELNHGEHTTAMFEDYNEELESLEKSGLEDGSRRQPRKPDESSIESAPTATPRYREATAPVLADEGNHGIENDHSEPTSWTLHDMLAESRLTIIPLCHQQCSGHRRRILQKDTEVAMRNSQIKRQMEDQSLITQWPSPLPKNKLLLHLVQQRRTDEFVGDVMRDGRMLSWAPELRDAFGSGVYALMHCARGSRTAAPVDATPHGGPMEGVQLCKGCDHTAVAHTVHDLPKKRPPEDVQMREAAEVLAGLGNVQETTNVFPGSEPVSTAPVSSPLSSAGTIEI